MANLAYDPTGDKERMEKEHGKKPSGGGGSSGETMEVPIWGCKIRVHFKLVDNTYICTRCGWGVIKGYFFRNYVHEQHCPLK